MPDSSLLFITLSNYSNSSVALHPFLFLHLIQVESFFARVKKEGEYEIEYTSEKLIKIRASFFV